MSSRNAIFILMTPSSIDKNTIYEYRVAYCKTIKDIFYDTRTGGDLADGQGNKEHLAKLFGHSEVYLTETDARLRAHSLFNEIKKCGLPIESALAYLHLYMYFPEEISHK